jgi:GNAT superfamily N-acetyltransferase
VPAIPPDGYTIRDATTADIPAIVRHRLRMFEDMGVAVDTRTVSAAFATWLDVHLPAGTYRAWLVEHHDRVVAGGGMSVLPWPPGPRELSGRLPIVYNVYTEPAHRRRGLARAIMQAMHAWCLQAGYRTVGLAASDEGRSLYDSLGYRESPQPYLFVTLEDAIGSWP